MGATNLTANQDFGIKIARAGYNALTAPDYGLLFNSAWPSLQIAFEYTLTVAEAESLGEVKHGLGFPPLTMIWYTADNISYGRLPGSYFEVDQESILFILIGGGLSNTATLVIRCYNTDISKDVNYPLPQSLARQGPYDTNYGFKIAKDNKNVNSRNLNDFIVHTKGQSPAILTIATELGQYYVNTSNRDYWANGNPPSGGWDLIAYPLSTNYIPWFTGAYVIGNTYAYLNIADIYYAPVVGVNGSLVLNVSSTGGTLIVLRDPLFYPTKIEVTYNG